MTSTVTSRITIPYPHPPEPTMPLTLFILQALAELFSASAPSTTSGGGNIDTALQLGPR